MSIGPAPGVWRVVTVLAAGLLVAACGTEAPTTSSPSSASASEPVTTSAKPSSTGSLVSPDPSAGPPGEAPSASASPLTTTPSSAGGASRIDGFAESVDDVGDAERVPLQDATVAVLAAEDARRLWEAIEFTPDEAQLGTVGGLVPGDVFVADRLATVDGGRFSLDLDDGDYLVCLLGGTGPYALRGCAAAAVAGPAAWHVSTGEGGVSLSTD